jgi:RND superfamily putative drug exporter
VLVIIEVRMREYAHAGIACDARAATFSVVRPVLVIAACAVLAVVAGVTGRGLFARLGYAVFYDPGAESTRAARLAHEQFGEGDPDVVALYRLRVDDPKARAQLVDAMTRVRALPSVARVVDATGAAGERFVSADRRSTFALISLRGTPRDKAAALPGVRAALVAGEVTPQLGGLVPSGRALTRLAEQSLARGERIALPLTALLLVAIFGSVVAALVPVVIGGLSIVLALGALALLSRVMTVDAFAINVVTILGLGVAIDYALFIVSRYREEGSLERAMRTAGRVVLFSGVTVAASLAGLLVFAQPFLRSVAVGGIVVVLLAAALALIALPALLALLGPRIEWGRLPRPWRGRGHAPFRRVGRVVLRRPALVCVVATTLLLALALPFRRLQPSRSDVRSLPANEEPRQVAAAMARDFPSVTLTPLEIVVAFDGDAADPDRLAALFDYGARLAELDGVTRVDSIVSLAGAGTRDEASALADRIVMHRDYPGLASLLHGRYAMVRVSSSLPPDSPLGQSQVARVRTLAPPSGATVALFGQAAALHDFATGVRARAPLMLAVVAAAMFVVLLFAFRSLILPLKAMLMTALSLTASFGALVFVFQDGRLEQLLAYRSLGTIDATLPVVMFAVVFGLSMDYEVLILLRMRERWLATHDNRAAVLDGLERTGRLVTRAALLMVVVFSAFAAAPVIYVKALGLGLALAVLLDASVVRMLLVPAAMALLGRWNWWSPRLRAC